MSRDPKSTIKKNRLPAAKSDVVDVTPPSLIVNDDPINILLVDDEPKNLTALEAVLGNSGYRLIRATSADEALLALVAEEFALLILDIQMPVMNGFELAKMIKERKKTAGIPIIFLTAYYSEDEHVLEGYSSGAVDFLHKPINAVVLRSKVAVFADLHRKTRETLLANRALNTEVAERQQAQEQLRELNATLEQRVTERTEELRSTEEFNRSIVESSRDCVQVLDLEGILLIMFPGGQKMLGIDDIGSYLGKSWLDFWEGDDLQAARTACATAATGGTGNFVGFYRTLRGEPKWWDVVISPICDVSGKPVRLLAASRDVTERRRGELNLTFLASISHDLSSLTGVEEVMHVVSEKIGTHLDLSLCTFIEINEAVDEINVTHDWHRKDVPGVVGVYQVAEFLTDDFQKACRAGETFVVRDTVADPRANAEKFAALKIGSFVGVPLIRDGQWRFLLCASHSEPYDWRDDEIELTRELTERIWIRRERLRVEEALRVSEERFRVLFDHGPVAIFSCNRQAVIQNYNRRAAELWGREPHCGEDGEQHCGSVKLYHSDGRPLPHAESPILDVLRTGIMVQDVEVFIERPDGSRIAVVVTFAPLKNEEGEVTGAITAFYDITERRAMERALRSSEARKDAILQSALDAIITMDHEGNFVEFNPAAEKIFGYTRADILGKSLAEMIIPERLRERHKQGMARYLATGVGPVLNQQIELPAVRSDGTEFPAELAIIPIPHSQPPLFTAFMRDVTERKHTEQALRSSEERFRGMANAMPQLAWTARPDGYISWYNQRWYDYTGTTPEQMEGWGWQSVHDVTELPKVLERWKGSIATGDLFEMTFPLRGADGLFRLFLTRVIPLRDATGRVLQWFGTNTDVHELKSIEAALAARSAELVRADRNKDEFLAMLAHELRNPLAPLRSAAEILRVTDASAEEREQAQRIVGRQIENMSRMIDDLLDVSRITEGRIDLRREPVALEAILTATASLARPGCAAHGQKLNLSLPTEPVFLNADATRLEQVFGNLLTNASKYSGEGTHIWLKAERETLIEPPHVIISVRDDGVGIAPELLPHIFDLFVQSSRSLDRKHGGLGIGLTLVQRLVKLHGGNVEAHSEGLGHGSEFIVRLPILSEAPPPSPPPILSPPATCETARRMLIVDDNTDSARSMAMLQNRRGHETRTAFTGPDAVTTAAEFLPEVVLLDIGLPGMDGFEVARRIRAMPALAGVFIVAMSGYGRDEDRAEARLAGFDEYLVKPVDIDRLREWLRTRL